MGSASRSKSSRSSGNPTAFSRLKDQLQTVDLLFEVRDARLPLASKHPKAEELFGMKPRIVVLAKQDLADANALPHWLEQLNSGGEQASLALSFKLAKGQDKLLNLAMKLTEGKRQALERRGLLPRPMRACVVGLPNVGKSTLINWLIGKHKTQTGDRPGITRGTQWVRVHPKLDLLDTPGILPPTAFSQDTSYKLSLCNILPNSGLDVEDVANYGLAFLAAEHAQALKVYDIDLVDKEASLDNVARARACLATGGKLDRRRAASIFINDFRSGKLGRFILDSQ